MAAGAYPNKRLLGALAFALAMHAGGCHGPSDADSDANDGEADSAAGATGGGGSAGGDGGSAGEDGGSAGEDGGSSAADGGSLAPAFDQDLVDRACQYPLVDFRKTNSGGKNPWGDVATGEMDVARAVSYLALVAYFSPDRPCDTTTVSRRLRDQLHAAVLAGQEPAPNGAMNGFWSYSHFAMAIALARHTPGVQNMISADDQDRLDWLMRALTATTAYGLMYDSYPSHGLDNETDSMMGHSFTNHWVGWHALMVYAMDYFDGVAGLDAFLKGFDYDTLMNKAKTFGWTRMTSEHSLGAVYPGTPHSLRDLLYYGGKDARGKSVASIRKDFFAQVDYNAKKNQYVESSRKTNDPWKIFKDLTLHYMFCGEVVDETQVVLNGETMRTGLIDMSQSSPYLGEHVQAAEWATHLCPEFWTSRSNGHYVSAGLGEYMPWAGFMRVRGYWAPGAEGSDMRNHITRGFRDTQFKVRVGWSGRTNDGVEEVWTEDAFYSDFWGGRFIRDIHDAVVAP